MGVGGRFDPGKETRYPFYRRLGGPRGRSEWVPKMLPQPGLDSRTVQSVKIRYNDWAIPAQNLDIGYTKYSACQIITCSLLSNIYVDTNLEPWHAGDMAPLWALSVVFIVTAL
jgi:hypothetical protein